jgi:hypothetical protein
MQAAADLYSRMVLEQAPRVLSLMDREILSPTAGCCDRTYWAWKFVDFPGARFQEAMCVLSFLYATALPGSPYFRNPRLLRWIALGIRYWCSIQYDDGSFDEAYPYERSLAATAFTSFYVSEALRFLGEDLPEVERARAIAALRRAGDWLTANDETHGFLSNHLAAAAGALYHVFVLTQEDRFGERSRYFIDKILRRQSKEGWYEEYGGADPGYQTHGTFYLARCWQLSRNELLFDSLRRSMEFLGLFTHVDGSIGGEYASRNTQTYYPAAFEMFAPHSGPAAWIAERMRPAVETCAAAGLRSVDVYNYFPFLNNLVFAHLACAPPGGAMADPVEPSPEDGVIWLREAGLARVRRARYDAYVGVSKGAVLKVFDRARRRLVYNDAGYIGRLRGGQLFSSQSDGSGRRAEVTRDHIVIEGVFYEVSRPVMKPFRFVGFRLFMLSAGRLPGLARWLKKYLVKALIYRRKALNIRFRRRIEFGEDHILVRDEIAGRGGTQVESLQRGEVFATIHMGSSRYFIMNELEPAGRVDPPVEPGIAPQEIAGGVVLTRAVGFARETSA